MTANDDFAVSGYLRRYRQEGINVVVLSQGGEVLLPFDVKLTLKSPFEKRSAVAERFLIPEDSRCDTLYEKSAAARSTNIPTSYN